MRLLAAFITGSILCHHTPTLYAASASNDSQAASTAKPEKAISIGSDFLLEDNEVIVALSLRKKTMLSDGMIAYSAKGDIALPLEQLMLLLEFPIKQDKSALTASGWYIAQQRAFSLDVAKGIVSSDGQTFTFDQSEILNIEGELFVPTALLAEWLPLAFNTNLRALNINITPKEPIAIDQRITRKNKTFGVTYFNTSRNQEVNTPYQLLSLPQVDINFNLGNNSGNKDIYSAYTLRARGDLAYMASSLYVTGNQDKVSDGRIVLSRKDPRGRLLGQLDATEFSVGDVSARSLPLISAGASGRGLHVSRRVAGYAANLETITLEGVLESGYDVELYRNDVLIDSEIASGKTRYNFEGVNLFNGENLFRLEFYGPQGQRRTQTKRYFVGNGKLKKGQLYFDVGLTQPNKTVFGINSESTTDEYVSNKLAVSAVMDYGLTSRITINGGLARQPDENSDDVRTYAIGGLTGQIGNFLTRFNAAVDDKGGYAASINASTKIKNVNVSLTQESFLNDFVSNKGFDETTDLQIKSRSSINLRTNSNKLIKHATIGVGLSASRSELDNGSLSYTANSNLSFQRKTLSVSTNLSYSNQDSSDLEQFSGSSSLSYRLSKANLKLSTNYTLKPESELINASFSLSRKFSNQYTTSLSFYENFQDESRSISASLSRDFGRFELGLTASHAVDLDDNSTSSVFLNASFGLFGRSNEGTRTLLGDRHSGSSVQALAFFDENQDGVFNPSERAIPEVKFFGGNNKGAVADKNGKALLSKLNTGAWTDLSLEVDSLPNANWKASTAGVAILPRPGVLSRVQLPVIATADVEGIVSLNNRPMGNIGIEVLKTNKRTGKFELIQQTATAFDGLYVLTGIPVGDIVIRVNPAQGTRLAVSGALSKKILLTAETDFLEYQDFKLTRK